MASNPRTTNGNARRKLKRRMVAEGLPCHLCGYPIDYEAHHLDPQSFVIDELVTVRDGGSTTQRSNCAPAHRCCNSWRGCKDVTPQLQRAIRSRYEREVLHRAAKSKRPLYEVEDGFW